MRKYLFILIVLIIFLFSGCSWREYFVIINQSNDEILVEYQLEKYKVSFNNGIFDNELILNPLDNNNELDWSKTLPIIDTDTTLLSVRCIIPKNTALTFGMLANDRYKHHNQAFINGRIFNLKQIKITHKDKNIIITTGNFDDLFIKKNGIITYKIK